MSENLGFTHGPTAVRFFDLIKRLADEDINPTQMQSLTVSVAMLDRMADERDNPAGSSISQSMKDSARAVCDQRSVRAALRRRKQ